MTAPVLLRLEDGDEEMGDLRSNLLTTRSRLVAQFKPPSEVGGPARRAPPMSAACPS